MWKMGSQNHVIPIVIKNDGKLEVDLKSARKVFKNPKLHGKKICIISISGEFRQGKFLMLNFFLRYLRQKEDNKKSSLPVQAVRSLLTKAYSSLTSKWFNQEDAVLIERGFASNGGMDGVTTGVLIHEEIFMVRKDGEEIAVLLMDTQGLFDGKEDSANTSVLFALSTLFSSVQIYNISQQIGENDLECLEIFTEFAKKTEHVNSSNRPFQRLIFLIRDWSNPHQFPHGMVGGAQFLDWVRKKRGPIVTEKMEYLSNSFESISCCLLPYPGRAVAERNSSSRLTLHDMDEAFLDQVDKFVQEILTPDNLVVKCVNGHSIHAGTIMTLLEDSMERLKSGNLPTSELMTQTVGKFQNLEAMQMSVEEYIDSFSKAMEDKKFYDDAFLNDIHTKLYVESLEKYTNATKFGGDDVRLKYRKYLEITLKRQYGGFKNKNNIEKTAAEKEVWNLIQSLTNEYERKFKDSLQVEERDYVEDIYLESQHRTILSNTLQTYDSDELAEYFPKKREALEKSTNRVFQMVKQDNETARKRAEENERKLEEKEKIDLLEMEQNLITDFCTKMSQENRVLLQIETELISDFRNAILQRASEFIEEHTFSELCERGRRNAVDTLDRQLAKMKLPHHNVRVALAEKIQNEIETFTARNNDMKGFTDASGRSQGNDASISLLPRHGLNDFPAHGSPEGPASVRLTQFNSPRQPQDSRDGDSGNGNDAMDIAVDFNTAGTIDEDTAAKLPHDFADDSIPETVGFTVPSEYQDAKRKKMKKNPSVTKVYNICHSNVIIGSAENTEQQADSANGNASSSTTRILTTEPKDSETREQELKTANLVKSPSEIPKGQGWVKLTDKIYLNKWTTLKRGTKVYEGRQKIGLVWRNVAIKLIPYDKENYKEVHFLSKLDHPNVIRIFDADEFHDSLTSYIYIVMERCLCCLKDFISQKNKLDFELMLSYAKQLVSGVAFIHKNNILHRDLKPENVLISPSRDYIRVADFGLSKKLEDGRSVADISSPGLGTDGFRAPEMYRQNPVASFYSDSFSLGIILHMMFSKGKHPCGSDRYRWRTSIMDKEKMYIDQMCEFQEAHSDKRDQLLNLLKVILSYDPKNRITPTEMLHHPFFTDASLQASNQDFKEMSISNKVCLKEDGEPLD